MTRLHASYLAESAARTCALCTIIANLCVHMLCGAIACAVTVVQRIPESSLLKRT